MKLTNLLLLSFCASISHAQVIKSSVADDPKALTHTINWALREKTEYADGENIVEIQNTGNNLVQLGYTAKLSTEKHGLILHKFDKNGKEILTNKLEDG